MFEQPVSPAYEQVAEIERYDVSEDGETWHPYDPRRDRNRVLHTRIIFGPDED